MNQSVLSGHLSLCGVKHCGKTTAAQALSRLLQRRAADTDDVLRELHERRTGEELSVREIFRQLGDTAFRRLEMDAVRQICGSPEPLILALGGGTLSNSGMTDDFLPQLGVICWLDVEDEVVYQRILADGLPPFLASEPDPFAALCRRNEKIRAACEAKAHIVIRYGTGSPQYIAEQIVKKYEEFIK